MLNFDKLWLYMYHNRNYSNYISDLFASIKLLEEGRLEGIPIEYQQYVINIPGLL